MRNHHFQMDTNVFKNALLNIVFPHDGICLSCGKNVISKEGDYLNNQYPFSEDILYDNPHALYNDNTALGFCDKCMQGIHHISGHVCTQCGLTMPECGGNICYECASNDIVFTKVMTVGEYRGVLKKMIFDLKYNRKTYLALVLAKLMFQKIYHSIWFDEIDIIVPVPLHDHRKMQRGFNQMDLIGEHLSKMSGIDIDVDALKRVKNTKALKGLNREDRMNTISASFERSSDVSGARVLLIDDIFTTGSTLRECAKTLINAGAMTVYGAVLSGARLQDENLV